MLKRIFICFLILLTNSLIAQWDSCETCWPRYPIRSVCFVPFSDAYPLYFHGYNRTELHITPAGYLRWDTVEVSNSYDSISNVGYIRFKYPNGSTSEGKFSLHLKADSVEGLPFRYIELIPDSTWRTESADRKYLHILNYKKGQAHGVRLLMVDSVVKVWGEYRYSRPTGRWITTGNNDAKIICDYDKNGYDSSSIAYWSYRSPYLKWESHRTDGNFISRMSGDTMVCHFRTISIGYDSLGIPIRKIIAYSNCTDTSSIQISYTEWYPNGTVRREILFDEDRASLVTFTPAGIVESVQYYKNASVYDGYIYGTKTGTHIFYKDNGEIDHVENY